MQIKFLTPNSSAAHLNVAGLQFAADCSGAPHRVQRELVRPFRLFDFQRGLKHHVVRFHHHTQEPTHNTRTL